MNSSKIAGNKKPKAILYALLAAVFYALNVPMSKILLGHVGTTMLAALLYLGAGIGIGLGAGVAGGIKRLTTKNTGIERLTKKDFPFVVGMILLDIAAPIFLMLGLHYGTSSNASLLASSSW